MKKAILLLLIFTGHTLAVVAQKPLPPTPYENSGYTDTPRYKETIDYCTLLDKQSDQVSFSTFGKSARGRDIPLLILDRDGFSTPEAIRRAGRIILLLQACIHPGESEGKDAGLLLLRNFVHPNDGKENRIPDPELLNNVSVIFIPIFNIDGHERFGPYNRINQNGPRETGWRTTATNLNLNRDFLKADSPEMRAWLAMFNRWMPDFFMDIHTTDGADYQYVLTYLMEIFGNMDQGLTSWCTENFIPEMEAKMEAQGMPVFPYVTFRNWHDPRSGLRSEAAPPMLSQSYSSLRNRPGLLIETHMLKPYRQRVNATYEVALTTMEILAREKVKLGILIRQADLFASSDAFRNELYPLALETSRQDSVMREFLGYEYEIIKSDLTGGDWFQYSSRPAAYMLPYFAKSQPQNETQLPMAYIVPAEWTNVLEVIFAHGVDHTILKEETTIPVMRYRFKNPSWQQMPYEGRHRVIRLELEEFSETYSFPAGSVVVPVAQPAVRIIAHLLEPKGNGSLVQWGFFDAVFEQKEYGESYVVERMARLMIRDDPALLNEFEEKKRTDTLFAKNHWEMINWFYKKSKFADNRHMVYPIGRIFDEAVLEKIMKR